MRLRYFGSIGGSSPRAWGTRESGGGKMIAIRFIPTRVGNTRDGGDSVGHRLVHPHARGEHPAAALAQPDFVGSSPRAWGTQATTRKFREGAWFIPTRVGNTDEGCASRPAAPVHPHARGEHVSGVILKLGMNGSSPRAWGTLAEDRSPQCAGRFIPTRVGNTAAAQVLVPNIPVHPHARGEHAEGSPEPASAAGSSPRAWGTPFGR